MAYSLAEAAEAVGMARSSILRAIKAGKISATRDEHGQWQIEPAELHRVYDPAPAAATTRTDELIAELRARLEDMRAALATAERNAETWRVAFEREQAQRALPTPSTDAQQAVQQPDQPAEQPSRFRRVWRWMQATG
jgi:Helix-turn-helix domain